MAIKDKWDRMFRKSVSSSSSGSAGGHNDLATTTSSSQSDGTTPIGPSAGPELCKAPSRLAKTLTWRSNKTGGTESSESKKERKRREKQQRKEEREQRAAAAIPKVKVHPSERPLTETNLRHQELLSTFTMNFGRRRISSAGRTSYSGVSPGNSRPGSIDLGGRPPMDFVGHHGPRHHHERGIGSLGDDDVPQEESGEDEREG